MLVFGCLGLGLDLGAALVLLTSRRVRGRVLRATRCAEGDQARGSDNNPSQYWMGHEARGVWIGWWLYVVSDGEPLQRFEVHLD